MTYILYLHTYILEGASIEKDWQKGKKRDEYFFLREHTSKS